MERGAASDPEAPMPFRVPRRHPRGVFDRGSDPDTRFSLANERTFLAWTRTSLALVAGAVAVHSPLLDLSQPAAIGLSIWLLVLAALCVQQGWYRWRHVELALRTGRLMPGFGGALVLTIGATVLITTVAAGILINVLA
jgi:inner membrane protein YidH